MTPKEKAKNLVYKFMEHAYSTDVDEDGHPFTNNLLWSGNSKQCALIAVEEITTRYCGRIDELEYWEQVKQEINKL